MSAETPRTKRFRADVSDLVSFSVGGKVFVAARATLCTYPNSMLARVFERDSTIGHTTDSEGRVFLCRAPDMFEHVLAWLRSGRFVCPMITHEIVTDEAISLQHGEPTDRSMLREEDDELEVAHRPLIVVKKSIMDPEFLIKLDAEADYFGLDELRSRIRLASRRLPVKVWYDYAAPACLLQSWGFSAKELYRDFTITNGKWYSPEELFPMCVQDTILPVGPDKPKYDETPYVIALGGLAGEHGKVGILSHDSPVVARLRLMDSPFAEIEDYPEISLDKFTSVRYLRFD
jgi:hypothetical protein